MKNRLLYWIMASIIFHSLLFTSIKLVDSDFINKFSKTTNQTVTIRAILAQEKVEQDKPKKISNNIMGKKNKQVQASRKQRVLEKSKSLVDQGKNSLISKYLSSIRKKIQKNKVSNQIIKRMKMKGEIYLRFKINRPNTISGLTIIESSGRKHLDNAALKTVSTLSAIPQIPVGLEMNEVNIEIRIKYN